MDILNEKIEGLVKKAEKSGMPYGILKKVYDRGMAAWKTGHRPGTTPQQWAFARVNSFVTKSSGTWGKADKDLAKQVRGEDVEVPKTKSAKELIGQIKEKLPKDADAGDYVKDFRKSKAPQFKGKSDKKIQKMAIAAYLDSKEEKDLDEENLQEMEVKYIHTRDPQGFMNTYSGTSASKGLSMLSKDSPRKGEYLIRGDKKNHDVFQKMLKGRGIRPEIKIMKEENLQELINFDRQFKNPKKEVMVMFTKGPDKGRGFVIDKKDLPKFERQGAIQIESKLKEENCPDCGEDPCKCKSLQESGHTDVPSMKTQVQIAMDALQKMNTELGKLSDEDELPTWWTNKVSTAVSKLDGMADYIDAKHDQGQKMNESKMGAFVLDMQIDAQEMKERDFIKKYQGEMGMSAQELKRMYKEFNEEVNLDEQFVHTVRFEKEGIRFAVPFYDKKKAENGKKVLQKSQGVSNISITKDLLKPGIKLAGEGKISVDKDHIVENPMVHAAALATSVWAERRHIDPADIDMKATAADRKAADKNIIIQLRRAQDMEKQTGRADQTGIEFLDKKKQKVDPKIVNKALDMFDRMKPNEKQKMQQSIGKSYRDLLKTVQRGRV